MLRTGIAKLCISLCVVTIFSLSFLKIAKNRKKNEGCDDIHFMQGTYLEIRKSKIENTYSLDEWPEELVYNIDIKIPKVAPFVPVKKITLSAKKDNGYAEDECKKEKSDFYCAKKNFDRNYILYIHIKKDHKEYRKIFDATSEYLRREVFCH